MAADHILDIKLSPLDDEGESSSHERDFVLANETQQMAQIASIIEFHPNDHRNHIQEFVIEAIC